MINSSPDLVFSPSDFVAVLNQTLEFAYPSVTVVGEIANYRVSRGKWLYFDLKDDQSSVKFFGTVYNLTTPLEDGMVVRVMGYPKLHNLYGFSVNVQTIRPEGEGSLKKAQDLLAAKLEKEGLFKPERKRGLPYPPQIIGLVAAKDSAGYADFIKILNERWGGITVYHHEVQVQGEKAVADVSSAIDYINKQAEDVDVIVVLRGGGSADDLAAFSTEPVVRAVASSRIPTMVAIGHEVDISLAELAADVRASTPSNAAELLVPDKNQESARLKQARTQLKQSLNSTLKEADSFIKNYKKDFFEALQYKLNFQKEQLQSKRMLLTALNPQKVLERGFAVIESSGAVVKTAASLKSGDNVSLRFRDGKVKARVE